MQQSFENRRKRQQGAGGHPLLRMIRIGSALFTAFIGFVLVAAYIWLEGFGRYLSEGGTLGGYGDAAHPGPNATTDPASTSRFHAFILVAAPIIAGVIGYLIAALSTDWYLRRVARRQAGGQSEQP